MPQLLFMSGSSQVGSVNWRLAGAAADLARRRLGDRASVVWIDLVELDLPRYGEKAEDQAQASVTALRDAVRDADGLFITSDEYTGTYSANLKNALAWLRQEGEESGTVLAGMVVALCGASIGGIRALRGQPALQQLLEELGATVISKLLPLGASSNPFQADGRLTSSAESWILNGCLIELVRQAIRRNEAGLRNRGLSA